MLLVAAALCLWGGPARVDSGGVDGEGRSIRAAGGRGAFLDEMLSLLRKGGGIGMRGVLLRPAVWRHKMGEGGLLRLRGGALRGDGESARVADVTKTRIKASRANIRPTTMMELDEEEDEAKVKRRERGGIVLEEGDTPDVDKVDPSVTRVKLGLGEPLPVRHAHANKIVGERTTPKRKKLEVWEDEDLDGEDPIVLQDSKIAKRAKIEVVKKAVINCTLGVAHGLFNVTELAVFLQQRIKVNGKMGKRQSAVQVRVQGDNIVVTTPYATQLKRHRTWSRKLSLADAFSTRYLKYLMKKFICKIELRDILRCVSTDFSLASRAKGGTGQTFEIRYTNVWKQRSLRVKFGQMYGTRMESERRKILQEDHFYHNKDDIQLESFDQLLPRKIKATGVHRPPVRIPCAFIAWERQAGCLMRAYIIVLDPYNSNVVPPNRGKGWRD